jgi:ribose 5-phosphate isomerase B
VDVKSWQEHLRGRRGPPSAGAPSGRTAMRVAIGADHGGFALKESLKATLRDCGAVVDDVGTTSTDPVDYPDIAAAVASRVTTGACDRGIVVDAAGPGSCMAANKIRGIRAAACHDEHTARNSREHQDANVLVLGSRFVSVGHARRIVRIWLATTFAGGRHARRVEKIDALDRGR